MHHFPPLHSFLSLFSSLLPSSYPHVYLFTHPCPSFPPPTLCPPSWTLLRYELNTYQPTFKYTKLSIFLSTHTPIYSPTHPSFHPSICLYICVCLSLYLYLSKCPSVFLHPCLHVYGTALNSFISIFVLNFPLVHPAMQLHTYISIYHYSHFSPSPSFIVLHDLSYIEYNTIMNWRFLKQYLCWVVKSSSQH